MNLFTVVGFHLNLGKMKRMKPLNMAKRWISEDRDQDGLEKRFVSNEIGKLVMTGNIE
jgi:hypothetical protein